MAEILFLTWNSARLLALVLNALTGLMQYYEHKPTSLESDSIFALKVAQGHLDELYSTFYNNEFHSDIFFTIKNLSDSARQISINAFKSLEKFDSTTFKELKFLLTHRFKIGIYPYRKIDENLRWPVKNLLPRDEIHKSRTWFKKKESPDFFHCVILLKSTNCSELSSQCLDKIIRQKGLIGFEISRQVFFISIAKLMNGCADKINKYLINIATLNLQKNKSENQIYDNNLDVYISERCSNIHDELVRFRRDKKRLARVVSSSLDLIMEQTFVCLKFGFIEFANPHFFITALSWQHPVLGCYTNQKPDSIPNMGLLTDFQKNDYLQLRHSTKNNLCIEHTSAVVILSLVVYLRYLLNPSPWPEFQFADQLVQIDKIVSEDRFSHFKYVKWVRDSSLHLMHESHKVLPKPPPMTWSPDLIAFVILLLVFVTGSIVAHYIWGNNVGDNFKIGGKRMYPYAFKKL